MKVLQKKLTYQEIRSMEFDDNNPFWYELINGELVQKQSPTITHRHIPKRIERHLDEYARKTQSGEMFHAPLNVVLDDNSGYHPDVFSIKKDRFFILDEKEEVVIGSPDLVIEILSKSTASEDKGSKKDNYEKYGVREYWLMKPRNESVEVYVLKDDRYRLNCYLEEEGIVKSTVPEGFELEISKIF
jgi:Uma2 family endonuclease